MVTDQQNLQNLGSASRLAMYHVNLDLTPVAEWSDVDMVNYLDEFKNIILAHPESFSAQSTATAHYIDQKNMQDLIAPDWVSDNGDDLRTLQYQMQNNIYAAGDDLAKLGQGALNLLGSVGGAATNIGQIAEHSSGAAALLIPIIGLAVLYIIVNDPARGVAVAGTAARSAAGTARALF